jgi:rhodanese-related sulfurtransferase
MPIDFIIKNWELFLALVVILALFAAGPLMQFIHGIKNIGPMQAVQLINREGGVFVDVCQPEEYKAGHIPNSLNVPLTALRQPPKQLDKYKGKPVVVSCRSGNRSVKGAVMLRKQGFQTVYSLSGGLVGWQRDNLPLEK